jgi:homoserine dehydrogenase
MSPINRATGHPAIDYLELALNLGLHAITANKGPVVHGYRRLSALAQQQGKAFLFESTVMDGFPLLNLYRECLPATRVLSFRGVLNSTTNLILNLMENGKTFEEAVKHAQDIGIAETDPSNDIDGWDAAVKVCVLSNVLMGGHPPAGCRSHRHSRHHAEMIKEAQQHAANGGVVLPDGWTVESQGRAEEIPRTIRCFAIRHHERDPNQTDTLNQLTLLKQRYWPTAFAC